MAATIDTTASAFRQPYPIKDQIDPIVALLGAEAIVTFITNEAENGLGKLVSAGSVTVGALEGSAMLMRLAVNELRRQEIAAPRHFSPG
jgi:hypothetical protein